MILYQKIIYHLQLEIKTFWNKVIQYINQTNLKNYIEKIFNIKKLKIKKLKITIFNNLFKNIKVKIHQLYLVILHNN